MKTRILHQHPRKMLLLAAVAVLAGLFFLSPRGPREPVYQGKTLTEWINEPGHPPHGYKSPETYAALNAIGTNALPFLLSEFTRPISRRWDRLRGRVNSLPYLNMHLRLDVERIRLAGRGLELLGTNAAPAVPVLIHWLDDSVRGDYAEVILFVSGDAALPHVIEALNATNTATPSRIVRILQNALSHSKSSPPALVPSLKHRDPKVRRQVVELLGSTIVQPERVMPALTEAASDPDFLVRERATNALERLTLAPALHVANAASNALLTLRTNASLRPK